MNSEKKKWNKTCHLKKKKTIKTDRNRQVFKTGSLHPNDARTVVIFIYFRKEKKTRY